MNQLFKDKTVNREFEQKGYVIVPFINASDVAELRSIFDEMVTESLTGLSCTNVYKTDDINRRIYDESKRIFEKHSDGIFHDYRMYGGPFVVKSNVDSHEMLLHQDWTFTDETQVHSGFIWCPLVDTHSDNGGMYVIEGSHNFFHTIRCANAEYKIYNSGELQEFITPVEVKAGHALVMHHGLLHGSFPNRSDQLRPVIMGTVLPANTELLYFSRSEKPGMVEKYTSDERMFINGVREILEGRIPECLTFEKLMEDPTEEVTKARIVEKAHTYRTENQSSLLKNGMKQIVTPLFQDATHQTAFDTDGFVKIPFLNESEAANLLEVYTNHSPAQIPGFYVSLASNDYTENKAINALIRQFIKVPSRRVFKDTSTFAESFMVKNNVGAKKLRLHQDWSCTLEETDNSAVLWCPLVDATIESGTMFFIKGSHRYFENVRSGTFPSAEIEADPEFEPYLTPVELKAGELLVFNPAIIHGSYNNVAGYPRIVLFACMKSDYSTLAYHHKSGQAGMADVYEIPAETFLKESMSLGMGEKPADGKLLKTVPYRHYMITKADILEGIGRFYRKNESTDPADLYANNKVPV